MNFEESQSAYLAMLQSQAQKLIAKNSIDRDTIRGILVLHQVVEASEFLSLHIGTAALTNILIDIARDDYSDDARMNALYWLWHEARPELIIQHESVFLNLLDDEEYDFLTDFAILVLAKIKSSIGRERLERELSERGKECCVSANYCVWLEHALKIYTGDSTVACPCNRCGQELNVTQEK